MKKPLILTTILAAGSLLLLSAASYGQPGRHMRGQMRGPGGEAMLLHPRVQERLQISDQQKADIRAVLQQHRQARAGQTQELVGLRRELRVAIYADVADHGRIDSLKQQIASRLAENFTAQVEMQSRIAQILTPEQRQQLLEIEPRRMRGPARGERDRSGQPRQRGVPPPGEDGRL